MEVGNKNEIYSGEFQFEFPQLDLRSFSTIYQQKVIANIDQLGGLVSPVGRNGRVGA